MKSRTVKRRWIRKDGTVVIREYTYKQGRSRKGKVLVNDKGVVIQKNVNKFKAEIMNSKLSDAEKRTLVSDLDARIRQRKKSKHKLTTTGFAGLQQDQEIERLFANAGYSIEEAAKEYGIDELALRDAGNWAGETFNYGGVSYAFNFNYTGALFTRV